MEYHQLRLRESGNIVWIEFHLLFPKGTLLDDAHNIATKLENTIKKNLKTQANIITHLEPLNYIMKFILSNIIKINTWG